MVKGVKVLYLDEEILNLLKDINASKLITDLLKEHFAIKKHSLFDEIKQKRKEKQREIKDLNKKFKFFSKLDELGIDERALNWIKGNLPNPNEEDWGRYCRSRRINAKLNKVVDLVNNNKEFLKWD